MMKKKAWLEYATGRGRKTERTTASDYLSQVVDYGGLLVRRGDIELHLKHLGGGEGPGTYRLTNRPEIPGARPTHRFSPEVGDFVPLTESYKREHDNTPGPYKTVLTTFDFAYSHDEGPNDVWVDRLQGELAVFVSPDGWTLYDNPDGVGDHIATGLNVATLEDALEEET